jgi:hypothetical protein
MIMKNIFLVFCLIFVGCASPNQVTSQEIIDREYSTYQKQKKLGETHEEKIKDGFIYWKESKIVGGHFKSPLGGTWFYDDIEEQYYRAIIPKQNK